MSNVAYTPHYDRQNAWLEMLGPQPDANVLSGKVEADYVVIGGGFAGLSATRRLAQLLPDQRIVLIEGDRIGNNAAGRCSGFIIDHAHNIRSKGFAEDTENATRQIALNRAGIDWLESIVREHDIDCDWRRTGKIHAAATDKGRQSLASFAASLDAVNEDYQILDAAELKRRFGTGFYVEGMNAPHSVTVQPAALVTGLARTMPANVTVYESSMVTSFQWGPPHVLTTARGAITAPNVILAANGFGEAFGQYRNRLLPLITWGSMTRELTADEVAALGGDESYAIIPASPAGTSVRRIPGNRILIRNQYTFSRRSDAIKGRDAVRRIHERSFRNRYPMLPNVEFEYTWGGALSLSRNGKGVCGPLGPGLWSSMVCQGVGGAKLSISGKMLAEWIATGEQHRDIELLTGNDQPSRNYPDPFNTWGVKINARWRRWQAGIEE